MQNGRISDETPTEIVQTKPKRVEVQTEEFFSPIEIQTEETYVKVHTEEIDAADEFSTEETSIEVHIEKTKADVKHSYQRNWSRGSNRRN